MHQRVYEKVKKKTQNHSSTCFLKRCFYIFLFLPHIVPSPILLMNFQFSTLSLPLFPFPPFSFPQNKRGHSSFLKLSVSNISLHLGTACCGSAHTHTHTQRKKEIIIINNNSQNDKVLKLQEQKKMRKTRKQKL